MPLYPGNDTVTFVNPAIVADRLHHVSAAGQASAVVIGCSMQPVSVADRISDTSYSESTDKCIAPANATSEACRAEWQLVFTPPGAAQQTFRVLGVKPFRDVWGRTDHVTIMCKSESG